MSIKVKIFGLNISLDDFRYQNKELALDAKII